MDITEEIRRIAAQAETLCRQWRPDVDDDEQWEALQEAIDLLDERAGSGLAIGKYVRFHVADGEAFYIIDAIQDQVVHCIWVANLDERTSVAVDSEGWCLRRVAADKIGRRERA